METTYEQVCEFLKGKGFKGPQEIPSQYSPLFYKRVDDVAPMCLCNDLQQLCIWVHDIDLGGGTRRRTLSFEVSGEYTPDNWVKIEVYSMEWDRAMREFDQLCEHALAAWKALCAFRK